MHARSADKLTRHFVAGFERANPMAAGRRIGAELKFPFVDGAGRAVARSAVDALWEHLAALGWQPDIDPPSGRAVGARKAGERNDTVASCETGYCKTEFSLAHADNLHALQRTLDGVIADLRPFLDARGLHLLCYGIQPVTPPSGALLMKKMRAGFWDKALPSNRVIPADQGDDVHLFTVNACSHVHISTPREEAVPLVNVLNGLAGAQIALTAHSNRTGPWPPEACQCLNEKLWDWWEPVRGRVGVPEHPFEDLSDYAVRIFDLKPIYVKRDGQPILLCDHYERFADYFAAAEAVGRTVDGQPYPLTPALEDIAVHNSCYWYTARISRYYTVENRVFDQQPREALLAPAALTLGLACALPEAREALAQHDWAVLRETREQACRHGMQWQLDGLKAAALVGAMLAVAEEGLRRRALGEGVFLEPLKARLNAGHCPADAIAAFPDAAWPAVLLERYAL